MRRYSPLVLQYKEEELVTEATRSIWRLVFTMTTRRLIMVLGNDRG